MSYTGSYLSPAAKDSKVNFQVHSDNLHSGFCTFIFQAAYYSSTLFLVQLTATEFLIRKAILPSVLQTHLISHAANGYTVDYDVKAHA